jgi:hypothetical protein
VDLSEQRIHHFMLTDTESNQRTYGACLSFSHLFDPPRRGPEGETCPVDSPESVCIQEWGVLSLCVLSHYPYFTFLQKALLSLHHFVEHFFGEDLTWNALIHGGVCEASGEGHRAVVEIEKWVGQLLTMRAPQQGQSALEVELEVDPAVTVSIPPANRLPLLDLSVCRLFQRLGVCCVLEIFKLVLGEQKVFLYSEDVSFVSECVLVLLSLLYPLQYLFPCIPLLPTSMPTAENLLMVPTPFFIGVHKSFIDKLGETRHSEAWMVNLDTKHLECPTCSDQQTVPEFPYSILQLQADIRKVLDYLEREGLLDWDREDSSIVSFATTGEDRLTALRDEVDVMIRVAFVEFLFSPEILGCTETFMVIYRLFTRPVVAIKTTAFVHGYQKSCPATNTEFIQNLIRSQGIEYFFEWSLNPSNSAFSEIRRGIHAVDRLSDKQYHYVHKSGLTIHQICLYTLSDESLLYQEMLAYKASHASYYLVSSTDLPSEEEEDESDWEILAATQHTNSVELPMSSPSSYTSEEHAPSFNLGAYPTHQLLVTATTPDYDAERLLRDPDVGVGFYPAALPQQLTEAEVHIPHPTFTGEVISNSVRVHPDEVDTPKSSVADPSPLTTVAIDTPPVATDTLSVPVETPSPIPMRRPGLSPDEKRVFYPVRNAAVRVTSFVPDSLQLPPGPRKRIVISSSSSLTSSCDGDESEVASDDSVDGVIPRSRALPHSATGPRKTRWTGSYEYLAPGGHREGVSRAHSVSPTPFSCSSVDSYSEDDTVLVTRRRVDTYRNAQTHGSLFNLSPAPSMEVVEFSTPYRVPSPSNSSLGRSSSLRLPRERHTSPYPPSFTNSSQAPMATMSRTVPLSAITHTKVLEHQIQELVQKLLDGQGLPLIKPPALRRMAGYEKTRVMVLRQLETELGVRRPGDLKMATDSQILPVGVSKAVYRGLLDLLKYFLGYVEEELQKEPEASIFSVFLLLRIAFSIFLLPKGSSSKPRTPPGKRRPPAQDSPLSFLPPISTAITPATLTPGKTFAISNSPRRSPVLPRRDTANNREHRSLHQDDRESTPQQSAAVGTPVRARMRRDEEREEYGEESNSSRVADDAPTPKVSLDFTNTSIYYNTPSAATPPLSGRVHEFPFSRSSSNTTESRSHSRSGRPPPPPLQKRGSPLVAMHRRLRSEADLNNLLGTGSGYNKDTQFIYKDITKALGPSGRAFMMERMFWNVLFMSVVTVERGYLGWNENTADLYQR